MLDFIFVKKYNDTQIKRLKEKLTYVKNLLSV